VFYIIFKIKKFNNQQKQKTGTFIFLEIFKYLLEITAPFKAADKLCRPINPPPKPPTIKEKFEEIELN